MNKSIFLIIPAIVLITITGCKKKKEEEQAPVSTKGAIVFTVFIKDFTTENKIKSATVKVGTSQANVDKNVLIANLVSGADGKCKVEDIEQGDYYFRATYTDSSNMAGFIQEGSITLAGGTEYLKNVSLKQNSGPSTLKIYAVYPPAGTDSIAAGATIMIDYDYTKINAGTPMLQLTADINGKATFTNLVPDTIWTRTIVTIGSTNLDYKTGVLIKDTDRNQQYRLVLK